MKRIVLFFIFTLCLASFAQAATVDFNNLINYDNQPTSGSVTVTDGGLTATFTNNIWQAYAMPITVTANTRLNFLYKSTDQPEIAAIGFDTDTVFVFDHEENAFKVWGNQTIWDINPLTPYTGAGEYQEYSILLSDYFAIGTTFDYLYFLNDDDGVHGGDGVSNSTFSNVSATPIPGAAWLLGSGLVGLVGLRRRFQG